MVMSLVAALGLMTSCDADWLEVQNPNGEPLEEYYVNEKTITEALNAAYAVVTEKIGG